MLNFTRDPADIADVRRSTPYWILGALACGWLLSASLAGQEPPEEPAKKLRARDLFDGSQVHDIWIHIHPRDWEQLLGGYRENTYYPTDMEWRGIRVRNVGVRIRGRLSRTPHKPGLRLDFNYYVTGQEFLGLKSLVLDNLWQDPSMIRERLAMLVFQRMGLPAPREAHARVYIGGDREFAGVYGIVEPIDQEFLKHNFHEDDGYLYEYHWLNPFSFEDPVAGLDWYAARFEPRTHQTESTAVLFGPVRDLVRAVSEAPKSQLEEALKPYLNLRNFITHIAIDNFISQPDGVIGGVGMNNFYLYRFHEKSLSQLLVWDQDLAFESLNTPPWQNLESNILSRKIWAVPELREIYLRKLLELSRSIGSPPGTRNVVDPSSRQCPASDDEPPCSWLEQEISREYEQIHESALEDTRAPYSSEQFEQAIEFLKYFARRRGEVVGRYIGQLNPALVNSGSASRAR